MEMDDREIVRRVAAILEVEIDDMGYAKDKDGQIYADWNPLTNLNHCWLVVERMRELGWGFKLKSYGDKLYRAHFYKYGGFPQNKENRICYAICLAAIKEVEA